MEQTSGTSYPNVLIADYLKKTGRANPGLMMKALELINIGYQRILTFQQPGGGFSWWARPGDPEQPWVTAYGLQQLIDTAKVHEVDPNVIARAQKYLFGQQAEDGSWKTVGHTHGVAIEGFRNPALPLTGYIAWTLAESGARGPNLVRALEFIRKNVRRETNPYVLALCACALFAADDRDEDGHTIMERLIGMARQEGDRIIYEPKGQTMSFARHGSAAIETTALATYAALLAGTYPSIVQKGLNQIIHARSPRGTWGSTQATILALKCLVRAMSGKKPEKTIHVAVRLDGEERRIVIDPDQADVLQLVDFGAVKPGTHKLSIETEGEGTLMYQAVARHFMPWDRVKEAEEEKPITLSVEYDRTRLSTKDVLTANVEMRYRGKMATYMVIVDLGIPPGFDVQTGAFEKMLEAGRITRYETTGRQIVLYFGEVRPGETVRFSYGLKPRYPVKVKTPSSQAYEYYTPENRARTKPVRLEVTK